MKTLSFIISIQLLCAIANAQQIQLSNAAIDSMQYKMSKYKTSGSIMLPVGIAAIAGGLTWMAVSLNNDPNFIWETDDSVDYTPQYLGAMAVCAAGGVLLGIGIRNLVRAKRLKKVLSGVSMGVAPGYLPINSSVNMSRTSLQTAISLQIPISR